MEPTTNDVLSGRGAWFNQHSGNRRFRKMLDERKVRDLRASSFHLNYIKIPSQSRKRKPSQPTAYTHIHTQFCRLLTNLYDSSTHFMLSNVRVLFFKECLYDWYEEAKDGHIQFHRRGYSFDGSTGQISQTMPWNWPMERAVEKRCNR